MRFPGRRGRAATVDFHLYPLSVAFCDPFIFHAVESWLRQAQDPFAELVQPTLDDPERASQLVEACTAAHYGRHFPTYYIKQWFGHF